MHQNFWQCTLGVALRHNHCHIRRSLCTPISTLNMVASSTGMNTHTASHVFLMPAAVADALAVELGLGALTLSPGALPWDVCMA
jgi:hypothetical protein